MKIITIMSLMNTIYHVAYKMLHSCPCNAVLAPPSPRPVSALSLLVLCRVSLLIGFAGFGPRNLALSNGRNLRPDPAEGWRSGRRIVVFPGALLLLVRDTTKRDLVLGWSAQMCLISRKRDFESDSNAWTRSVLHDCDLPSSR